MLAIVVVYISSGADSGNGIASISGLVVLLKVLVLEVLLMLLVVLVIVS